MAKKKAPAKPRIMNISAVTGRIVSNDYAKKHPNTVIKHKVK